MDVEEYIEKIVKEGSIQEMEHLSDMLEDLLEMIQEYDPACYKEYEMQLYKMAYGMKLNKQMAEEIVSKMTPYGKRWSIEETRRMQEEYGVDNIDNVDFYVVINSAFNDFRDLFGDNIESYIKYTVDFIRDEDAKQDKVFLYYTTIVKN